ncbi:MAG: hypothetical protein IKA22_11475, partial [Lentisphaeria bacterium]|nr:hypothetical protein [Lentisphaeria bacterium]
NGYHNHIMSLIHLLLVEILLQFLFDTGNIITNLFQHVKVLRNCGELQKNGIVNADLILEFR